MTSFTPVKLAFSSFESEEGSEDKPPIILMHGVTACKEYWEDVPQKIANGTKRKVYAIDFRNHGDSEWTDEFNFDCNVVDLLEFMNSIHAQKVILVGHSMGGIAAIHTSLRCPERVEKLVVEDISVKQIAKPLLEMVVGALSTAIKAMETMPPGLDQETAEKFIVDYMFENMPEEVKKIIKRDDASSRVLGKMMRKQGDRYIMKANMDVIIKALKETESLLSEPTGVCESPACFIYGRKSPFPVFQDADQIKEHFPNVEFFGTDATHNVHTDCPQEFIDIVLKFIAKE